MKTNVGPADRVARAVIGLVLVSLVFVWSGPGRWVGLLGLIPLLTAFVGSCPLYTMLGLSTCSASKHG